MDGLLHLVQRRGDWAHSRETSKALRHGSQSVLPANKHHACLYLVSVHQMAPPLTCTNVRLTVAYYSSIDPKNDERLSWLTYSGRFTHISGHPSAGGRVQDRKVRRSQIAPDFTEIRPQ